MNEITWESFPYDLRAPGGATTPLGDAKLLDAGDRYDYLPNH